MIKKEKVSFGRLNVLYRLGSKPSRLFLHDGTFRYTYAAFRIRRSLDSTLLVSPPVGIVCVGVFDL